jgi:MFS family permease
MKKLSGGNSIILLLILRALYSMNWYNVSPMLFNITSTYHVSASLSGLILSAFLIGTGLFQIPSGLVASKIGSKNTALTGMVVMSIAATTSLVSNNFTLFLITRFVVGLGSAFFFSSGIAVLNDIDEKNVSKNIAAFNTAFSIGGGFGVVGFAYFLQFVPWQTLLAIGGLVTLFLTAIAFVFIPDLSTRRSYSGTFKKNIYKRITSRPLLLLSISLSGYWGLNFTFEEYLQPFASNLGFNSSISGLIGSLSLFAGIIGMLLFSFVSNKKTSTTLPSIVIFISAIIAFQFFGLPYYLFITAILGGSISVIIFSLEYSYVVKIETEKQFVAFGISIMNALQIGIGSLITFIFGYLFAYNNKLSWVILPIICLLFLPLGIGVFKNDRREQPRINN